MSLRLATLVVGALVLAGCSATPSAGPTTDLATPSSTPTPTKATKAVFGTLDVQADTGANIIKKQTAIDGPCSVESGYDDIEDGGQVAILDANGATVALTNLESTGLQIEPGKTSMVHTWCGFTFEAPAVPTGRGFYAITTGHRDPYRIAEAELFSSDLELKLGDIPGH